MSSPSSAGRPGTGPGRVDVRAERTVDRHRRVVLLNNYPMREALRLVREGTYPAQHLWGMWETVGVHDWRIAAPPPRPGRHSARLERWARRLDPLLGDLRQELGALRLARRGDVIYAADQQSAALLGALRRLRLLRAELVVVVHNGPRLRWTRFWLRGASSLLCLSEVVADRLEAQVGRRATVMPWGPSRQCELYVRARAKQTGPALAFVAAGKTNRRYDALVAAARAHGLSGTIFDGTRVRRFAAGRESSEVRPVTYPEIIDEMARARAVVIPIADRSRLSGLTEIADAIALGKPYLVSRGANIPESMRRHAVELDTDSEDELAVALTRDHVPPGSGRDVPDMRAYVEVLEATFASVG
jgi:hypothetical protein